VDIVIYLCTYIYIYIICVCKYLYLRSADECGDIYLMEREKNWRKNTHAVHHFDHRNGITAVAAATRIVFSFSSFGR